eukprot:9470607-Pyramimonas_sp.AAC.1
MDNQLKQVVAQMFKVEKSIGEMVVKQGDPADNFYVIEQGDCSVFIVANGTSKLLGQLKAGDTFGEMALMYNSVRAASVQASTDVVVWALDRHNFVQVLESFQDSTTQFLRSVKLLAPLKDKDIAGLAEYSKVMNLNKGINIRINSQADGLACDLGSGRKWGEQWEKVRNWTRGEKRGRVSGVLSAPLLLLAQEDPYH